MESRPKAVLIPEGPSTPEKRGNHRIATKPPPKAAAIGLGQRTLALPYHHARTAVERIPPSETTNPILQDFTNDH